MTMGEDRADESIPTPTLEADIVDRARACVGARFRPQGRSIETGLDCVGVVVVSWGLPVAEVRADYRLRARGFEAIEGELGRVSDPVPQGTARPGDVLLLDAGGGQPHVVIVTPGGYVHAEPGARRVVEVPGPAALPVRSAWRPRGYLVHEGGRG